MKTRITFVLLSLASLTFFARHLPAQGSSQSDEMSHSHAAPTRTAGDGPKKASADFYDSQSRGNDFDGTKTLASIGFTDMHGGVASFSGGNLVLTPDGTHDGADAFTRDYVLRAAGIEQARDIGCRVVLPDKYLTGRATIGLLLRFRADGTGLLLNFALNASPSLIAYSVANGVMTRHGDGGLATPYDPSHPVALEARVLADSALAMTVTDLTTGSVLGFLNLPLDFGSIPAGGFGLVPWMTTPGTGSIAVRSIQSYAVTAVACDGDSLTAGENATVGRGTASPLATAYPGVLQKLLGNRYHVFNLGRSGFTVNQMNADAAGRVDGLLAGTEQPPFVVVEGGTNDFGIDGSIKPPVTVQQAVQTVYKRLQTYWAARHAARPGAVVIDVANMPAGHPVYAQNLGSGAGFNQRRDVLNALRKSAPDGRSARPDRLADLTQDSHIGQDGSERNATYFHAQDKTHLTDAGYAIKAAIIAKVIRQHASSLNATGATAWPFGR